ncbi:unnamed protein product [Symbiodinium natans]|uniref:Uncharacterized protein n=1 Tax=Symbiodinium natans TaxID=878477 RepID=A0A812LYF1_9DINO|nr:unnamed protein product [Symbiodinium natans]
MDFNFKIPLGCYTDASVKELRAFLSCTHRRAGEGSLPWRLAQRGPQLLLLISEFVLAPKVVLYAGCEDGRIKALELEPLPGNASRIREVESVAAPKKGHMANGGPAGPSASSAMLHSALQGLQ